MRLRAMLAALFVLLVVAPGAHAWTTIDGVADPLTAKLYRDWQAAAQVPTANVTVGIVESSDPCGGAGACLLRFTPGRMRWLWAEDDTAERQADRLGTQALLYHELGHVRDYMARKSRRYRAEFARQMGWRPLASLGRRERARYEASGVVGVYEGWGVCVQLPTRACVAPGELFAMATEWCSINRTERTLAEWASGYGYAPTAAQHVAICTMLAGRLP